MKPTELPAPDPTPIDEVSPSLANQLLSCQLRVGFARDPKLKRWRRPTTFTALGTAAHAVTEHTFKRRDWPADQSAIRDEILHCWDREIEVGAKQLAKEWAPATPPPPPEWPGYALTRARTLRRAVKHVTQPPAATAKVSGLPQVEVEVELRDPASGLFGRADRIERDGDTTRVVDLKTGLRQGEPTDEQRRQLLLYAVLVQRTTGSWPSSIAVEDASGTQHREVLDPLEAESLLVEVLEAVADFNEAQGSGDGLRAQPDAERCRWCAFRAICGPFWDAVGSDWGQRAALGRVMAAGEADGGSFVSLEVERPHDRAGASVHIAGLAESVPAGATTIAIVDWAGVAAADDARARWSTMIQTW